MDSEIEDNPGGECLIPTPTEASPLFLFNLLDFQVVSTEEKVFWF